MHSPHQVEKAQQLYVVLLDYLDGHFSEWAVKDAVVDLCRSFHGTLPSSEGVALWNDLDREFTLAGEGHFPEGEVADAATRLSGWISQYFNLGLGVGENGDEPNSQSVGRVNAQDWANDLDDVEEPEVSGDGSVGYASDRGDAEGDYPRTEHAE